MLLFIGIMNIIDGDIIDFDGVVQDKTFITAIFK